MDAEASSRAVQCARMVLECKAVSLVLERIWRRDYDGEYDSPDTKSLACIQTALIKTAKDFERRADCTSSTSVNILEGVRLVDAQR
jgi:hypothetical protein